jgi:hypothetical protein
MTFGFINTPTTFQRLMNYIFCLSEYSFVIVYLDNILIFSETEKNHLQYIKWTLDKFHKNQLFAKIKKCEWMQKKVAYLGHHISQGKITMDPKKIKAIKDWPLPTKVKKVKTFLELVNYYQ